MTGFRYRAARADGYTVRGVIEASSPTAATAAISALGLFPVEVRSVAGQRRGHRLRTNDLATVFRGLASLVGAGVPLQRALGFSARIAPIAVRARLDRVAQLVREGSAFSAALQAEPGFPDVLIGLVKAGERGVGLDAALDHAARELERRGELAARTRAALTYPLVLATVGLVSLVVIAVVVVPRFAALLEDVGASLPATTRALLTVSTTLERHWLSIGVIVVASSAASAFALSQSRDAWHRWLLRLPGIGPVRWSLATARAGRTLATLLGAGVPALPALRAAADAAGDRAVAERLSAVRDRVAEGARLSRALEAVAAFTPTAVQLATIGEESGRLPDLLERAADLEEANAERTLRAVVGILEPALIVCFAVVVAFVAAALLQAVYGLRLT